LTIIVTASGDFVLLILYLLRRCHCERSEAIQRTPSRVRNGQGNEPCHEGTFIARWARYWENIFYKPRKDWTATSFHSSQWQLLLEV